MVRRQALVVKELEPELEEVMNVVITMVNFVKCNALNTRLFRELCEDAESDYSKVLFYSDVRWLSRGNVLDRVCNLKDKFEMFLRKKGYPLAENFRNTMWVGHLAYMVDIFDHVNSLNKQLQGKYMGIISATEKIFVFTSKLVYWHQKAKQNKIYAFSNLGEFLEDFDQVSFDGAIEGVVTRHLIKLQERFCQYFPDLDTQTVSWIVNYFLCDVSKVLEKPEG